MMVLPYLWGKENVQNERQVKEMITITIGFWKNKNKEERKW